MSSGIQLKLLYSQWFIKQSEPLISHMWKQPSGDIHTGFSNGSEASSLIFNRRTNLKLFLSVTISNGQASNLILPLLKQSEIALLTLDQSILLQSFINLWVWTSLLIKPWVTCQDSPCFHYTLSEWDTNTCEWFSHLSN